MQSLVKETVGCYTAQVFLIESAMRSQRQSIVKARAVGALVGAFAMVAGGALASRLVFAPAASASGAPLSGEFVYTNDDLDVGNTVSGFSVALNGTLTPVAGSPFATGGDGG